MQPTSHLELNIGLDGEKKKCVGFLLCLRLFLLRNDYHYQADYLI